MAKYNITERKKKEASYIGALSTSLVEEIYEKILLKFVVEKTDAQGHIWMWNKSKKIGIVIKNL